MQRRPVDGRSNFTSTRHKVAFPQRFYDRDYHFTAYALAGFIQRRRRASDAGHRNPKLYGFYSRRADCIGELRDLQQQRHYELSDENGRQFLPDTDRPGSKKLNCTRAGIGSGIMYFY